MLKGKMVAKKLFNLLLFIVAITWKNAPEKQYPTVGTNYNVKCEVSADPGPTVDWLRQNGDQVSSFIILEINDQFVKILIFFLS